MVITACVPETTLDVADDTQTAITGLAVDQQRVAGTGDDHYRPGWGETPLVQQQAHEFLTNSLMIASSGGSHCSRCGLRTKNSDFPVFKLHRNIDPDY